jgi:hypothetical protein
MSDRRLPHDLDVERTVVAAIASPHRYRSAALDELGPDAFYDGRHVRVVTALRQRTPMSRADHAYLDWTLATAWPLCNRHLGELHDLTRRRAQALELVHQLDEVCAS